MVSTANLIYRNYEVDGVVSSGPHEPQKAEIRAWGSWVEGIIAAFNANGGLIYSTLALLNVDLAHAANSMAWVIGDPVTANNGVYGKVGASGIGSWTRRSDLPFSFIVGVDGGAGTPNALQATTAIPVSNSALIWVSVFEANTSSPVTISFNGGSALTVKTNSGSDVVPGGLVAGMIILGIVSGSTFRLVSDQASAAVVAAAEAAKTAAEAAKTAAEAAAAVATGAMSTVLDPLFATKAVAAAWSPVVAPDYIRTAGYTTAGDGGGALYKKVASAPSHQGKFSITLSGGGTVWFELAETVVTPEMFGALCDGSSNDGPAMQAALDAWRHVRLSPGKTYRITQSLVMSVSNSILESDGTATIFMPAASFNNTSLSTGRYAANAVGIYVHGGLVTPFTALKRPVLSGFKLTSEVQQGRYVSGIVLHNCTDIDVYNCDLSGFPLGIGIRIGSCTGGRVKNNKIHDFTDNTTGWNIADVPQVTAIEVDNDIFNSVPSSGLDISYNEISNITVGAAFLAAYGYQSDGINIPRINSQHHTITGNKISNVGEGIDHFGQFCVISDNIISSTYLFGIKLIHGASFNEVLGNLIDGYGLAGIVIAGSASAATAADNNRVDGNIIFNGNFNSAWSANENACILTQTNGGDTGTLSLPRNNVFSNNSLRPANGKWAINKGVSVSTNLYLNNKMSRGVSGWVTGAEPAFVNDALPTVVKASRSAAFTVAAGATSIVVCNTESVDRRAEYNNGAGTWTCQIPGEYRFAASVRVSAISTGKDVTLTITKNGVGVSVRSVTMSATSGSVSIDDVIVCAQDDVIDLRVTNGDTATATFGADPHTFMSLVSAA